MTVKIMLPIQLEGLASIGKLKSVHLEGCNEPNHARLKALTIEGEVIYTPCMNIKGAKKVLISIQEYIRISKLLALKGD